MAERVATESNGAPADLVRVGSVVVPIYHAPVRLKLKCPNTEHVVASITPTTKTYDSYLICHYEGSVRVQRRRNTLQRAREYAKEVASRLSRDGARAQFLTDHDRRIYALAQAAVQPLGWEVDEVCRRFVELQQRLKKGTIDEAVDFMNEHGQRVRPGVESSKVLEDYLKSQQERGAGDYHMRDIKRYLGGFVRAQPGVLSRVQTVDIDRFLASLGGRARNKNNHRDAIVAFFNFAREKGYLPPSLPHAAATCTEYRDPRTKITTEAQAAELMQPDDIYSPDEMRKILALGSIDALRPTLELKAFSGVRTEEIVRLWWIMVAETEECIRVPDAVGKIDARRVPLLPNLKRRLAAYSAETKRGRIAAEWASANSLYHAWQRACKEAAVPYRRNGFRNSYLTYRHVLLADAAKVAGEGGTSTEMMRKNYLSRSLISRATAEEWFSL